LTNTQKNADTLVANAVTALMAVFYRGDIRIQKSTTQTTPVQSSAAAAAPQSAPHAPLPVETTRT